MIKSIMTLFKCFNHFPLTKCFLFFVFFSSSFFSFFVIIFVTRFIVKSSKLKTYKNWFGFWFLGVPFFPLIILAPFRCDVGVELEKQLTDTEGDYHLPPAKMKAAKDTLLQVYPLRLDNKEALWEDRRIDRREVRSI